jgi:hypothetical protein
MAHYAILDENNFVVSLHVGRNENEIVLDSNGDPIDWEIYYGAKRTSYNTRGGIHYESDGNTPSNDQSKSFRKNFGQIGYYYDEIRDAFIPPKRFPSFVFNENSCIFEPPIPCPNDGQSYVWDEELLNWKLIPDDVY